MPDITMCSNKTCPLASSCYRNPKSGTVPDKWQSWTEFYYNGKYEYCEDYIEKIE
jgi:hypothetical protein